MVRLVEETEPLEAKAEELVGTGATVIQGVREARKANEIRWQGFLVELGQ